MRRLDYGQIWDALGLRGGKREGANRIIDLYHSRDFNNGLLIVSSYSWMKPYNREAHRHQADHYRSRSELERAARDNKLVRRLIHFGVIKLHPKLRPHLMKMRENEDGGVVLGPGHRRHSQAPYRLDAWRLYELSHDSFDE